MSAPLKGVKVIDLSLLLPGPLCSMYLADMGAEVIKIENPKSCDATRLVARSEKGLPGLFFMSNRNKKAITLNLKKEKAQEILLRLLEKADILLEGFRPEVLDEMGIGYKVLKEKFPRLIYCGISGFGASGTYKNWAGHDGNYLALSGVLEQLGPSERPSLAGFQLADVGGGTLTAVAAILAALYSREKTGRGQKIDVSMMESSLQFISLYAGIYLATGQLPQRGNELLSGKLANYHIYKTKDERFVFLGALEERFFRTFMKEICKEHLLLEGKTLEDQSEELKIVLQDYFLQNSLSDLQGLFVNPNCCLSPIKNIAEVLQDPHLLERGAIFSKKHPVYGDYFQFASPFRFSETPCEYNTHPPEHGEHNVQVYSELGYSAHDLERLKGESVI